MTWIALKIMSGREDTAARILKRHWGAFTYAPSFEGTRKRRGAGGTVVLEKRAVRIFPGLLWVRFKARRPTMDALRICPSILGALAAEGKWLAFTAGDMDALRRAATRGRQTAKPAVKRSLAKGDKAKILTGAFAGHEATIESLRGAVASMDVVLFGRTNRVKIPVANLGKAA